jgi:hypothetical protein|tara:strand:+ start:733 stop:927 length:195 start_codon:yes stop_codon:yes gene_type:complete
MVYHYVDQSIIDEIYNFYELGEENNENNKFAEGIVKDILERYCNAQHFNPELKPESTTDTQSLL